MDKNFDDWNKLKKRLDNLNVSPFFNEREIWWCSIGINIGSEIYGKGNTFTRPVLILKKIGKNSFFGIPLSTKVRNKSGYYKFHFEEKEICAVMYNLKKMDGKRLGKKIGKLPSNKFEDLKCDMKSMIFDSQKGSRRT